MPTRVVCPRGHVNVLGGTFSNVQLSGSGAMNLAVDCKVCGVTFDAAPGGSVQVDTTADGKLSVRQLTRFVRDSDTETLSALRHELQAAVAANDFLRAQAALQQTGASPSPVAPGMSSNETRVWNLVMVLLAVLAIVISLKTGGQSVTPEQIEQIVQTVEHDQGSRPVDHRLGRNAKCWCGSGLKYKRCHGQHPSVQQHR